MIQTMMRKTYNKPAMHVEVFTPQEYCVVCPEENMYVINPVSPPTGGHGDHLYMNGNGCGTFQGPVVPNSQPITISKEAYPTIAAMLKDSKLWQLGFKNGNHFDAQTGYDYYSIATSSNSYGGHIDASNVGTFHATYCEDNASQNALIILDASGSIIKNRS